jgi:hypothetical protein
MSIRIEGNMQTQQENGSRAHHENTPPDYASLVA